MCTAITYHTDCFYFGRTLDYDRTYGESVTITPRNFPLTFRAVPTPSDRFAILGMAHIAENYPLYYDAVNEKGLAMAGLNFAGNAVYRPAAANRDNIAHFELIPWLLCQCATVQEAKRLLRRLQLTNAQFSDKLPPAELHWLLSDKTETVTIEATADGMKIHENPVGVLTNNPPFPEQLRSLTRYLHLSPKPPINRFSSQLNLCPDSHGMGAVGLPGDLSSQSRFVRAAFAKLNAVSGAGEAESVGQFFHILDAVSQIRGCCNIGGDIYEQTIYSACCNADRGIYYYTTYGNRRITSVHLYRTNLNSDILLSYPLLTDEQILNQN